MPFCIAHHDINTLDIYVRLAEIISIKDLLEFKFFSADKPLDKAKSQG